MPMDYFEVECPDETGRRAYYDIAGDILQDLGLISAVSVLHIAIDPSYPYFIAAGRTKKLPPPVKAGDFANVMEDGGEVTLDITDEKYMAEMLTIFWDKYGRDTVRQPDRFTVKIPSSMTNAREIEETIVFDQSVTMYKDLLYALQWIAPEGFKVRREWIDGDRFYYVSSENTLLPQILDPIIQDKLAIADRAAEGFE